MDLCGLLFFQKVKHITIHMSHRVETNMLFTIIVFPSIESLIEDQYLNLHLSFSNKKLLALTNQVQG